MDLKIYDGQHGTMLFPHTSHIENDKIKRFFNEKIELYIEKDVIVTTYCKIHALKTADRVEVFYVVYSDIYNDEYFLRFKNEVEKALNNLDLKLVFNKDTDNIILRNIHIFNEQPPKTLPFKEFDDIMCMSNIHRHMELKAGNIGDIISFCKKILKSSGNINISISTGTAVIDEGDINILYDNNFQMPLTLTDKSRKILDDHKKEIEKNRLEQITRKKEEDGIKKIKEGAALIRDGTSIIEKIGRNAKDIVLKELNLDKKIEDKIRPKTNIIINIGGIHIVVVIGIIMFVLGALAGPYISPFLLDKAITIIPIGINTSIPNDDSTIDSTIDSIPSPTPIDNSTQSPTPTESPTASPTASSTPTESPTVTPTVSSPDGDTS